MACCNGGAAGGGAEGARRQWGRWTPTGDGEQLGGRGRRRRPRCLHQRPRRGRESGSHFLRTAQRGGRAARQTRMHAASRDVFESGTRAALLHRATAEPARLRQQQRRRGSTRSGLHRKVERILGGGGARTPLRSTRFGRRLQHGFRKTDAALLAAMLAEIVRVSTLRAGLQGR